MTGICFRWKMLKMRERRLVGHWELKRHSGVRNMVVHFDQPGSPSPSHLSQFVHWGAQVITFNEIWASQRHERLQTCGLCKNLIFMNLVKEKLRSASYRRYVWDMHPAVGPWGPEGHSDWAMHLSSYNLYGMMARCVCKWAWVWKRKNVPICFSRVSIKCKLWQLVCGLYRCFFLCLLICLTNKQTSNSCVDLEPCKIPHSWPFAMHISRRKIVGSM